MHFSAEFVCLLVVRVGRLELKVVHIHSHPSVSLIVVVLFLALFLEKWIFFLPVVGYDLAWYPLASLLFLSYSTLPRRALLLTTSNELGPLNFLHAYWGLFISRICWSLHCLQSNLESATMSQTKDRMSAYLNRMGNKYDVDYWYLHCALLP